MNKVECLDEAYRAWRGTDHGERVFALFERFALEAGSRSRRFGFAMIEERVRWETTMAYDDSPDFKINARYISRLAREIVAKHPRLEPLVRFRALRAA